MDEPRKAIVRWPSRRELLAVGVILAVVAAVLWQAYRNVVVGRNFVPCPSYMKQIALALLAYEQDSNGELPPPYRGAPQGWAARIPRGLVPARDFRCPTYGTPWSRQGDQTDDNLSLSPPSVTVSYAVNSNLCSGSKGFKVSKAIAPASTVLLFEVEGDRAQVSQPDEGTRGFTSPPPSSCLSAAGNGAGAIPQFGWFGSGPSPLRYATGSIGGRRTILGHARHFGGANYAALDGHVQWLPPGRVSGGTTNPSPTGQQDRPLGAAAGTQARSVTMTFSPH